jgi:hypothetical protein
MARFVQMLPKSGVYSDQNFMIVPQHGFNLVCLREGTDCRIDHDSRLDVQEVRFNQVDRIANEYMQKRVIGRDGADMLTRLRTSMYGTVASDSRAKLLKVSAQGAGIPVIKAKYGSVEVRLDVGILRRKEFSVAFKLVKHMNGQGAMVSLTKFHMADAQRWVDQLNWIFGAQTNIFFKLVGAEWVPIGRTLGQPMNADVFKKTLVPYKHGSANLTCFLVGKYKGDEHGVHAAGTYFGQEKVCVVDDGPHREFFDDWTYDSFVGVMAHEFAHFLGGPHHSRGSLLLSKGIETCELDKQLVAQLNPW